MKVVFVGEGQTLGMWNTDAVPAVGESVVLNGKSYVVKSRNWSGDPPSCWIILKEE